MPIQFPSITLQPDTFEQANPILSGLLKNQQMQQNQADILKTQLLNQLAQRTLGTSVEQAKAGLLKSQLENKLLQQTIPPKAGSLQQKYIQEQIENKLKAFQSQEAIKQYGGNIDFESIANQKIGQEPSSSAQNTEQKSGFAWQITPEQAQSLESGLKFAPKQINSEQNAYQIKKSDLDRMNRVGQLLNIGHPGAYTALRGQIQQGTPEEHERQVLDQKSLQESKENEKASYILQGYLKQYEEALNNISPLALNPIINNPITKGIINAFSPNYQQLESARGGIAQVLRQHFAVPSGSYHGVEQKALSTLAGDPEGKSKEILQKNVDIIKDMSDRLLLDSYLKQNYKDKNSNLEAYHPYQGGNNFPFKTKEEARNFVANLPTEVREAFFRQYKKGAK